MPMSVYAKEINFISTDSSKSPVEKIDQFFVQNSQKKNVIWAPKIKGKSRYSFSISRDAYYISKKHADASDLFYLSEQIDNGLRFHSNKSKNIDILISKNNSNLILSQSILPNINAGLFFKNKEAFNIFCISISDKSRSGEELRPLSE